MSRILVTAIFLAAILTACTADPKQVLFDQGHNQAFTIEEEGPLHLGNLAATLKKSELFVSATKDEISGEILASTDALIISGPFRPYSPKEIAAVKGFLQKGGRVAIMLHIAKPMWGLLDELGVDVANGVLRERNGTLENEPINFSVTDFAPHTLTNGLKSFNLYGGWPLRPAADHTQTIASSSDNAWVDLNGDAILNKGDVVQPFGIIVRGTIGQGEFVVFADDAIFQNKFLVEGNKALAANLGRWFAGR